MMILRNNQGACLQAGISEQSRSATAWIERQNRHCLLY